MVSSGAGEAEGVRAGAAADAAAVLSWEIALLSPACAVVQAIGRPRTPSRARRGARSMLPIIARPGRFVTSPWSDQLVGQSSSVNVPLGEGRAFSTAFGLPS